MFVRTSLRDVKLSDAGVKAVDRSETFGLSAIDAKDPNYSFQFNETPRFGCLRRSLSLQKSRGRCSANGCGAFNHVGNFADHPQVKMLAFAFLADGKGAT